MSDHDSGSTKEIALGFVAYNPSETLLNRLRVADRAGFACYLFDNSPHSPLVRQLRGSLTRYSYLTCGKNVGLGYGLASVCAHAYYDGYQALLFFDQDTIFTAETLGFIETWHRHNRLIPLTYSAVVFNASDEGDRARQSREVENVALAISSGSLFFLENVQRLNWHNEKYFVDCVDYEFCLRSRIHGFNVGRWSSTPGFDHESEQPDVKTKILGRIKPVRSYSRARISGTVVASTKLVFRAIGARQLSFAVLVMRSLGIYLLLQVVARIRLPIPANDPNG